MAYASNHKASSNVKFHELAESNVGTAIASDGNFNRLNVETEEFKRIDPLNIPNTNQNSPIRM